MDKSSESCFCLVLPQIQNTRERPERVTCLSLTRESIAPSMTIPLRLHEDLGEEIPRRDIRVILLLKKKTRDKCRAARRTGIHTWRGLRRMHFSTTLTPCSASWAIPCQGIERSHSLVCCGGQTPGMMQSRCHPSSKKSRERNRSPKKEIGSDHRGEGRRDGKSGSELGPEIWVRFQRVENGSVRSSLFLFPLRGKKNQSRREEDLLWSSVAGLWVQGEYVQRWG